MNEELCNRLLNWTFIDAWEIAKHAHLTCMQRGVIEALVSSYGNCGWFEGSAGVLVDNIVKALCKALKEGIDESESSEKA